MKVLLNSILRASLAARLWVALNGCMASKIVSNAIDGPGAVKSDTLGARDAEQKKNYWAALGYLVTVPVDIVTFPIQAIIAGVLTNNVAKEAGRGP